MLISILMPTYNRPDNLRRVFNSILETAAFPDEIEICLRTDHGDTSYIEPVKEFIDKIDIRICIGKKPEIGRAHV